MWSNQIKGYQLSVKDCQSSLSNLREHIQETCHTLCRESRLSLIKLFFFFTKSSPSWSMWIGNAVNERFRDMKWRLVRCPDQLKRQTGWGRMKEQHLFALTSTSEQSTLSKALHLYLIQVVLLWRRPWAARRQHWQCLLHVAFWLSSC